MGSRRKPLEQRSSIQMSPGTPAALKAIGDEALRIHESAEFSAQAQFEQSKIWRALNYWLGAPAAVLAATAGSAVLSSGTWSLWGMPGKALGGVLAIAAAALTAILTTINASRRMTQTQASGNAFLQLQTEARQFVTVDLAGMSPEEARAALKGITDSRNDLNKTADVPSWFAYKRAQRNLYHRGGQDYAVDKEE